MTEWQSIETAPTDGTEIVVLSRGDRWIVSWQTFILGAPIHGGWRVKALPGRDPIAYIKPTHWMPLPDAPQNPGDAAPESEE